MANDIHEEAAQDLDARLAKLEKTVSVPGAGERMMRRYLNRWLPIIEKAAGQGLYACLLEVADIDGLPENQQEVLALTAARIIREERFRISIGRTPVPVGATGDYILLVAW